MAYRTRLHGDLGWQATLITAQLTSSSSSLCLSPTHSPQLMITAAAHEEHFDVQGFNVQSAVGMMIQEGRGQNVLRLHKYKS